MWLMTMISPPCSSLLLANLFRSEDASTLGTVEDYAAHPPPWPSPTGAEGARAAQEGRESPGGKEMADGGAGGCWA